MNKKLIKYSIIFLVLTVSFIVWNLYSEKGNQSDILRLNASNGNIDVGSEEALWRGEIEENGAVNTYSFFKETYQSLGINKQHLLAHIFGGALYKEVGLLGVSVCDQTFSFGCYHEFLGRAIQDNGVPIIKELNQTCSEHLKEQALGCQHGIGHGILSYKGYDYESMASSLELCDTLEVYDPIGGCKGGVFMEYNMQTVLGNEGELRTFEEDKGAHFPCDVLDDTYKETCYFWQPQWWQSVLLDDLHRDVRVEGFKELGELCQEITDTSVRVQCYRGIGNNAPGSIGWEIESMQYMCSLMPTQEGEVECLAAAAGAFFANEQYRDISDELCEIEDEEKKAHCLTISQLPH